MDDLFRRRHTRHVVAAIWRLVLAVPQRPDDDRVRTEVVVSTPALAREPGHVAELLAEIVLG